VADLTTEIPGGAGTFTDITDVGIAVDEALAPEGPPIRVAFLGSGHDQQGVYVTPLTEAATPEGPPIRVADLTTPIPSGEGTFTAFRSLSAGGGHVAFLGEGPGGQSGIYMASTLTKIVAVDDVLDGRTVTAVHFGNEGLRDETVAFRAEFADGTSGVFTTTTGVYPFTGFFAPVGNPPIVNAVQAGRTIPAKFSLAGDRGLSILAPGYPVSRRVPCDANAPVEPVEQTVSSSSQELRYDAASDQYIYAWKTSRTWALTCRELEVGLRDGTVHTARFSFGA
jgi:hypothetical protein